MARRPSRPPAKPEPVAVAEVAHVPQFRLPARTLAIFVVAILCAHYAIAVSSLRQENPTVDEVNHLPAGISYWQTRTFKLYHQNPPLVKLIAALPVSRADMDPLYRSAEWDAYSPLPSFFGEWFMLLHAANYFELFTVSRMLMPGFSVLGGLFVFLWSRRLWGDLGGLLSLLLWCLCPNILAHARLITSDVAASSVGMAATYLFWRYLHAKTWRYAILAGVMLGLAQLTKFSLLLLYGIWPLMWLVRELCTFDRASALRRLILAAIQGMTIVIISLFVIDCGYGFEGVGRPLGSFDFASRSFLTAPGRTLRVEKNRILNLFWQHRVNRFRGTWMAGVPSPLPSHYLLGFDEQKIDADGIPASWAFKDVTDPDAVTGYPVYLDGEIRRTGWQSYYVKCLLYKMPEGTLFLIGLTPIALAFRRARASFPDEFALWFPPAMVLGAMTFLTNINIGLRYVLPMFPYVFIAAGRLAPWAWGLAGTARRIALTAVLLPLGLTIASTIAIYPHYLAYFNVLSGGPDRSPPHLIDSNLDWGQDLVGLRRWLREHREEGPVGIAYFGQITPNIFAQRGDPIDWFLPPARPGTLGPPSANVLRGPEPRLHRGLYAVSASLLQGLDWRVYDPSPLTWAGKWETREDPYRRKHTFDYFRALTPIANIGHSILIYRLTDDQAGRLNASLGLPAK